MSRALRKATFGIDSKTLDAVQQAVEQGAAPSKKAFVERALIHELDAFKRRKLAARWEEAAQDPLFLRDLDEIETAFRTADAESARRIG